MNRKKGFSLVGLSMCDIVARTGRHQQRYEAGCRLVAGFVNLFYFCIVYIYIYLILIDVDGVCLYGGEGDLCVPIVAGFFFTFNFVLCILTG